MARKQRNEPSWLSVLVGPIVLFTLLWILVVLPNFQGLFDSNAIPLKLPLSQLLGIKSSGTMQLIYWLITLLAFISWSFFILLLIRRRTERKLLFANAQSLEQIRALGPKQFEVFAADLFRQRGYKTKVTPYQGDHGIDIVANSPNGEKEVMQCKNYQGQVGEPIVRDFYGAMLHEGAARGWIVTTGVFTQQATTWAAGKPIELVDGDKLLSMIRLPRGRTKIETSQMSIAEAAVLSSKAPTESAPPVCPKHGVPMILKTAHQGPRKGKRFYGCPKFPDCREIINIDS